MHRARAAVALAAALTLTATPAQATPDPTTDPGPAATVLPQAATADPGPCPPARFRPRDFSDSADLDNAYQPLRPGTELTLQAVANDGGALLPHVVVLTATDLVKKIDGVWTRVLWQRDWRDGVAEVSALVFQAQDDDGAVWQLGEYPELIDDELPAGAPGAWIAGVTGARAGIVVPGDPDEDEPPYLRADAPGIGLLRCAFVVDTAADEVCAPAICYDDALIVEEFSPLLAPPVRHAYAPGIGLIAAAQANSDGETLFLSGRRGLSIAERLAADWQVVQLEDRAYESSGVYADTSPMRFHAGDEQAEAVRRLMEDRLRH
ncbi:hypothetical protein [Catellatospora sichuanensis]|uniref:hypothetical protein n=1 Tax=Catellatospora sichuanensis TaxID=1969805 RepID=UPI0011821C8F|nr:hypothetical protein [Catellatospora sichuanensis]